MGTGIHFPISNRGILDLVDRIVPPSDKHFLIDLVITIRDENLNVRSLCNYLMLIDGIRGRLYPEGFLSYSRRARSQIQISNIEKGSWEVIFSEQLSNVEYKILIVLWILLKYLPSAYKGYQEGRLLKVKRKQLESELKNDENLGNLDAKNIKVMTRLLYFLLQFEKKRISKAASFSKEKVKKVELKKRSHFDSERKGDKHG